MGYRLRRRLAGLAFRAGWHRLSAWLSPSQPRICLYDGDWNLMADADRGDAVLSELR